MEDEIFEMDELAVGPQRGAGNAGLSTFKEALPDCRSGDTLVETRECMPAWKAGCIRVIMQITRDPNPLKSW